MLRLTACWATHYSWLPDSVGPVSSKVLCFLLLCWLVDKASKRFAVDIPTVCAGEAVQFLLVAPLSPVPFLLPAKGPDSILHHGCPLA
jgi:integral membrane sensor domain MASE1